MRGRCCAMAQDPMAAALRLLSIRARSRHELDAALRRREVDLPERERILEKLAGWGYLDDARFARERAQALLRGGRFGEAAVLKRLANHGIERALAQSAVKAAVAQVDH